MAHGNASDIVFLVLFVTSIQSYFAPGLLFRNLDGSEASFSTTSPEMEALIKFSGALCFMLGMTFSGVKWNPANGKMAGLGCFLHTANAVSLATQTGLVFFWLSAAVLLCGGVHIFAFPSNRLPPKSPDTKNNHGNVSDIVCLLLLIGSVQSIFAPGLEFVDFGPVKASFGTEHQPALELMIRYCGSLILIAALMFSGIKWNPINGKMAGIGCFVFAASAAFVGSQVGSGIFFYFYAAMFLLGGLHVFAFPSNPLPPKPPAEDKLE